MKKLVVALIQPGVSVDNAANFTHVEGLIAAALNRTPLPQIVCLPERWYYVDPLSPQFDQNLQPPDGTQFQKVQSWARKFRIPIISGAIWEKRPEKNVICAYYIDGEGKVQFVQEKIHLYSLEKKHFTPGSDLVIFEDKILGIKFSVLICFDLNISSALSRLAVDNGAEILFSPTLIREKGAENWDVYVKARVLENRVPVVACNAVFKYLDRQYIGRSKIVQFKPDERSPLQLITHAAGENPEVLTVTVDLEFPNEIRRERLEENIEIEKISPILKSNQ